MRPPEWLDSHQRPSEIPGPIHRLVNAGASLKEVADVLGHASLDTTAVYAKVDLARLRHVAMPWPEGVR